MLNIYAISDLTNNLKIEFNEKEKVFPYCLSDLSSESLLSIYSNNKPLLKNLNSFLNLINENDFYFDWSFFKTNLLFFNCTTKILKAMWTNAYYYLYKSDMENVILEFSNIFNLLKPLKDLAFFSDYLSLGSYIGLVLGSLQKNRNSLHPYFQNKIIRDFTNCLNVQISDSLLIKRTLKFNSLFKTRLIEDLNTNELLDMDGKDPSDANNIEQYYSMCRILESRTQAKNIAKKMDSSLRTLKAEILLNLIDLALKSHKNFFGQYPKSLKELYNFSMVKQIRDPYSNSSFLYKKIDDQSYLMQSSGLLDLHDFEESGYHPLRILVKSDSVINSII